VNILIIVVVVIVVLLVVGAALSVRIVKQYEQGVLFRLGRVLGARAPGLRVIIPFADVLHRVSLRIVTMPIQSQGIITRDNVSVDVSMAHPLALQLRNLQSLVEIGVDKNTTVVFPAPLMTTIAELGTFLAREQAAATPALPPANDAAAIRTAAVNAAIGAPESA